MDAHEDDSDIKLQKISSDLIAEFSRSLPVFLRKPDGTLRARVRISETSRLISNLLDPFQELPQLLDPHLPTWLPLLSSTYLAHLTTHTRSRTPSSSTRSQLLEPLNLAIAKILYTFTKIRGEKVVVRFLNVETRYIEPLLSALESSERSLVTSRPSLTPLSPQSSSSPAVNPSNWSWEERYLVLLWLSHLLLAPFDLSTISSSASDPDLAPPPIPNFEWPTDLPGITVRILPLAIKYLASPGKERDGARALLVRIAMRRDMQSQGLLTALVNWSLASLIPLPETSPQPPYFYIGVLSFLAGVLRSSINTSDMDRYLSSIFRAAYAVASPDADTDADGSATQPTPVAAAIRSVAVARKMLIKVIRSVTVLLLRHSPLDPNSTDLIETSISYLLESLADNDTPVRFAASKALSIVTLKLDPDMASQVVDAVLDSLTRNVLWSRDPVDPSNRVRDLAAVDPLEWHGLTLTLSHLLYRRSPPATQLPAIIHALLLGLAFEKRSTSGTSIGTNVRDAACFGIWALARRYTTSELLALPTAEIQPRLPSSTSVLQLLATELVVTASLDPAGNIRRGASAALQELIGRHPDTVEKGIWVVQTVDYHAVALRSRAIHEVALNTTRLSPQYGAALLDALLGWRGVGDADAGSRRVAGVSFGTLTLELSRGGGGDARFAASVDKVLARLRALQTRQVDERHGLLLCLAAVLDRLPELLADGAENVAKNIPSIVRELETIFKDSQTTTYRRPELVAEASSRLIISSVPVLQAATFGSSEHPNPRPGRQVVSTSNTKDLLRVRTAVDTLEAIPEDVRRLVLTFGPVVTAGLARSEKEAVAASSEAALVLLVFSPPADRNHIIDEWSTAVKHRPSSRTANDTGMLSALTMAYPLTATATATAEVEDQGVVCGTILARWAGDNEIDTRVAILQSLSQSVVLRQRPLIFLDLLAEGLNDYTTNARGDVGSHVRLEALRATRALWQAAFTATDGSPDRHAAATERSGWLLTAVSKVFLRILRLAAEKLDRVRTEAHAVLALTLATSFASKFTKLTFSSKEYFHTLLNLYSDEASLHPLIADAARADAGAWMAELLAGYVTSADTGNEDLVIASRAALADFGAESPQKLTAVCVALAGNLKNRHGQDRVVVPTLEIVAFLSHVGLFQKCREVDLRQLCLLVQKAGYKTGNVRKLEACIKVYGSVAGFEEEGERVGRSSVEAGLSDRRRDGILEARKRLGALMLHPWPRVRSQVVDELWKLYGEDGRAECLQSVDWSKAEKASINQVVNQLCLTRSA
ncbi:Tubulin-specific chaperone D [Colletotrichum chlorophyti]|uniref:Tubulin-specific chaperone D n=1 Tax=Colletotrichum chlorophyti TaxID=708187 RepID=A0A1Q8RV39_9PEZI|nr:Tubulin-specific chaperone D [Colletotrichum chlorophyti]